MPLTSGSYNTQLIDVSTIKNQGFINPNVDDALIRGTIRIAQDMYLQELMGTNLYNDILTKKSLNTLSTIEQSLIDIQITPVIVWYTIHEGAFFNSFKFQNKGIEKMSGNVDSSAAANLQEIEAYQDKAKDRAEFYGQRLVGYLRSNTALFPAYLGNSFIQGDVFPQRTAYTSGIYLGNTTSYRCRRCNNYYSQCSCNNY